MPPGSNSTVGGSTRSTWRSWTRLRSIERPRSSRRIDLARAISAGIYPHWWTGRRFTTPVSVWGAGDTGKTVRNIIQEKLLGPLHQIGTGFIPAHLISNTQRKAGVPNAVELIWVKHVTGQLSVCELKSYEEPPEDIYAECLLRTTKTGDFVGGIILLVRLRVWNDGPGGSIRAEQTPLRTIS